MILSFFMTSFKVRVSSELQDTPAFFVRSMTPPWPKTTQNPATLIRVKPFKRVSCFPLDNPFYLMPMLLPEFTFFYVSCKFLHELFSFHPVDDGPPVFSTVAKKCPAVQTERHSWNTKHSTVSDQHEGNNNLEPKTPDWKVKVKLVNMTSILHEFFSWISSQKTIQNKIRGGEEYHKEPEWGPFRFYGRREDLCS